MSESKMVGWHHQFYGHEFEQAPGVGDGQGSLAYYRPWGHKESDMTEQLINNNYSQHVNQSIYTYQMFKILKIE